MIQIIKADGVAELALIDNLRTRAAEIGEEINRTAAQMMADVKERGYEAVREYSVKLDGAEPKEFSKEELQAAYDACDPKLISAMEHAANNIRDYNEHLLCKTVEWTNPDGGKVGRIVRGLTRVGVYVPGGTAAYPSSVLMNAVPAKVAGVKEIVMVTPPTENLNQAVLAAAKIAGVDRVIGVGGVQAVAALMYGAGFIPRVDKLVGPGSAYVAAAKRMAYGTVDIDMVAGPSEILIGGGRHRQPQVRGRRPDEPGGARQAGVSHAAHHQPGAGGGSRSRDHPPDVLPGTQRDHGAVLCQLRRRHRLRHLGALCGAGRSDRARSTWKSALPSPVPSCPTSTTQALSSWVTGRRSLWATISPAPPTFCPPQAPRGSSRPCPWTAF